MKDPRIRHVTVLLGERVLLPTLKSVKLNCIEASRDGVVDCPIECHYVGVYAIPAKSPELQEVFMGKHDIRDIRAVKVDLINVYFISGEWDTRSYLFYSGKKIFETYDDYGSSHIGLRFKMQWEGKTKYLIDYTGKMGRGGSVILTFDGEAAVTDVYEDEIDCVGQGC